MNTIIGTDIEKAKELLLQGKLVAIPTETVYGLAANAFNLDAVAKVFEVKNRPYFDPLIVHVSDLDQLYSLVSAVPKKAQLLIEKFSPGPLTLLLPKADAIQGLVTAGSSLVALRIPSHPLTLKLLKELPFPLAAPSANPFGYISPTTSSHVYDQLKNKIPYILEGGPSLVGIESTIIGFEEDIPTVYRLGGVSLDSLIELVGPVHVMPNSTSNPKAPGQLKSHYAPKKPFLIGDIATLLKENSTQRVGVLSFQKKYNIPYQIQLSKEGSLSSAAKNLFAAMRFLDQAPIDLILAEFVPNEGIGLAINDRLIRAAAKNS